MSPGESVLVLVVVVACIWWLLAPHTPRWIRDVEHRQKALGTLSKMQAEPDRAALAAVLYRDLDKDNWAEVKKFFDKEPTGSLLMIDVIDSDPPALSSQALATMKERIRMLAYKAGVAVDIGVKGRGYASGLLVEVRLLRS